MHCFLWLILPELTSKSRANPDLPIFNTTFSNLCTYFTFYTRKYFPFPMIRFSVSKALPSKIRSVTQAQFYFDKPQGFLAKSTSFWRISRMSDTISCFQITASTKKQPQKDAQLFPHVTKFSGSFPDSSSPLFPFAVIIVYHPDVRAGGVVMFISWRNVSLSSWNGGTVSNLATKLLGQQLTTPGTFRFLPRDIQLLSYIVLWILQTIWRNLNFF